MSEERKALVRRFYEEGYNKGNLAVVDEMLAPDITTHGIALSMPGREGFKQRITSFRTAFPDLRITVEDQIFEGDRGVVRLTWHGTQRGVYEGIAPTGKQATWTATVIARWSGNRVVEVWGNYDTLGLMQQLGAMPATASARR